MPGLAQAALCGSVQRPLDPARPQGVRIDIHLALLPALARHKAADPVFFFVGGPGQSAIGLAPALAARHARLGQRRDLVFIDQRGTGRSAPLRCADDGAGADLRPLAEQADAALRLQRLRACRLALQALPYGDLRFFTTALAAADVDAVRQALGVARINALGFSYGTRLVLDLMRQFPPTVRRAVLDGVAPPDMQLPAAAAPDNQAALDALFDACASQPACAQRHPTLRAQWAGLLARLPVDVLLPHPISGLPQPLRLQRDAVLGLVRAPLYSPALAAALPAAIDAAHAGRWAPLAALASPLGGAAAGSISSGLHFSVLCAEDLGPGAAPPQPAPVTATTPATSSALATAPAPAPAPAHAHAPAPAHAHASDFANSFADFYRQACAGWPRGAVSPAFYSMPPAQSPTWLLSGGLDPATPPRHAQRVAQALGRNARHTVVPNAGHGVLGQACLREAAARFITADDDATALAVDADCAQAVPRPLAFVAPGVTPGMTPGVAPGMAPGMTPGVAPGVTPGVASGLSPGMAPGLSPGLSPATAPGMPPNISPPAAGPAGQLTPMPGPAWAPASAPGHAAHRAGR